MGGDNVTTFKPEGGNGDLPVSAVLTLKLPPELPASFIGTMFFDGKAISSIRVPPSLEPNSVDLILTDPPYLAELGHLFRDLAKFAASVLKPSNPPARSVG